MFGRAIDRRKLVTMMALALLAGCKMIPKGPPEAPPPTTGPSADVLPTDTGRHRVALLVPLSGSNAAVGQSIANAATMALLDTNAQNLRVTTYDTSASASQAAEKAISDGNKLILGPLLSDNIPEVAVKARPAKVPVISFSNDETAATKDVFIIGSLPSQSVTRTIAYARSRGVTSFGALIPRGEYGQRASSALLSTARTSGGSVVAMEVYDRSSASVAGAAQRLRTKGGYEAVLIADGGRMASLAAPVLKPADKPNSTQLLGTELWSGESVIGSTPALRGAWFAAVADTRFNQFAKSYKSRFGGQPYRIATLGYDAVLLTLRVARDWRLGTIFPTDRMLDKGGFLGLDGPFRFGRNGVIERSLEVREVRAGGIAVVSPAPATFQD
ncbi:MAG: penicillin-binding protein activator [Novosphingobium sp.]|nr:penicillin-binding protein activator [Novosphingobium sp.]MCP5402574.1 penicillin-binding protein activator [Novosphingobium sp.]